jgi:hypothetical protein
VWIAKNWPIYKAKADKLDASTEITFYGLSEYLNGVRNFWTQDGCCEDEIPQFDEKEYVISDKWREVTTESTVFKVDDFGHQLSWEDNKDKFYRILYGTEIFD